MKRLLTLSFCAMFVVSMAVAGSVTGDYLEARNADVFVGACFSNAEAGFAGDMAILGWKISRGTWQGVKLDGLSVAGVVRAKGTLGDPANSAYPVRAVLLVDERASAEQRLALRAFAQRAAGDLLSDVVRVEYVPMTFAFEGDDVHSMKAVFAAGALARVETRAMQKGDHLCANPEVTYLPLTKLNHAMGATATTHWFRGQGLDMVHNTPGKPSAYVGTFQFSE
ncbi:MAG: DUF1326 domain-containing protein [Bryobacteraceae bacterium]